MSTFPSRAIACFSFFLTKFWFIYVRVFWNHFLRKSTTSYFFIWILLFFLKHSPPFKIYDEFFHNLVYIQFYAAVKMSRKMCCWEYDCKVCRNDTVSAPNFSTWINTVLLYFWQLHFDGICGLLLVTVCSNAVYIKNGNSGAPQYFNCSKQGECCKRIHS